MVTPTIRQVVLDGIDVRQLAEFYRELFGYTYRAGDEPGAPGADELEWLVLRGPDGAVQLAFQQVEHMAPTTWPDAAVPMQLHLDCSVPDVESLQEVLHRAEGLGAAVRFDRSDDPDEPLYVLTDPAGHPFCVFVSST